MPDELIYAKLSGLISSPLRVEFENDELHLSQGILYLCYPKDAIVRDRKAWVQLVETLNSILQEADNANLHSGKKE